MTEWPEVFLAVSALGLVAKVGDCVLAPVEADKVLGDVDGGVWLPGIISIVLSGDSDSSSYKIKNLISMSLSWQALKGNFPTCVHGSMVIACKQY